MSGLRYDVRHALRLFWDQPAFTAAAALTLALGLGVNIAVFIVFHAALLASLPVQRPNELMRIVTWTPNGGNHFDFSYPLYRDLRDHAEAFAGVSAYTARPVGVAVGPISERVIGEFVTANYFSVLGVDLPVGPGFTADDERGNSGPLVIISDRLQRSMFTSGAVPIGNTLLVNGHAATVVGVAPPTFVGFVRGQRADVWLTVNQSWSLIEERPNTLENRNLSWLLLMGRLRQGVRPEVAQDRLTASLRAAVSATEGTNWSVRLLPATSGDLGLVEDLDRPLRLLMIVVGFILIIAAANVGNLLLTRAYGRQHEMATRVALGASRWRIIRQLLIEGGVLATAGGVLGLLLGVWTATLFDIRTSGSAAPLALSIEPDATVLAFAALASAIVAIAIGVVPALGSSRPDLLAAIKAAGEVATTRIGKRNLRTSLTVVQVALALVLVIGAGLFLRSLGRLRAVDPALLNNRVIAGILDLTLLGYSEGRGRQFYDAALDSARSLPGVQAATLTSVLPATPGGTRENLGARQTDPSLDVPVEFDIVTTAPGYFATIGVPLVSGRDFSAGDSAPAPPVAIVNEAMKRMFWREANPTGRTFKAGSETFLVVGVARDTKYRSLRERSHMTMYVPLAQSYRSEMQLVVRAVLPPEQMVDALRSRLRSLDSGLPLYNVRTLAEHVERSLYLDRLRAQLIGLLAGLALALAGIGIYAVLSYSIAERTREVGVRLALGARPADVVRMLVVASARLAFMGIGCGLLLASWMTQLIAAQLFGLSAMDVPTIAAACSLLLVVALAATLVPARRATRVDPVVALRRT
jgi:putative ABC transport system permease protein